MFTAMIDKLALLVLVSYCKSHNLKSLFPIFWFLTWGRIEVILPGMKGVYLIAEAAMLKV